MNEIGKLFSDNQSLILAITAGVFFLLSIVLFFLYRKIRTQRNEAWDWSDSKDEDMAGMEELHKAELNQRKQDYFELLKKKSDLEDKLSVAQNRADCAEGKLRAYNNKVDALPMAFKVWRNTGQSFAAAHQEVLDCLKK